MINSKFKCRDKVWFMNVDKPVSRFVYQITQVNNQTIWYTLTSKCFYIEIPCFYIDEKHLHRTKKDLLSNNSKLK